MNSLDHLGIAVKSLAKARKFYESLGMKVLNEEVVEHERVRVAMVPVGESRIELLEPTQEDSPVGRFLSRRGEGLHQYGRPDPHRRRKAARHFRPRPSESPEGPFATC